MKKLFPVFSVIVLIIALLGAVVQETIAPSSGYVELVQLRSTLWGIEQAVMGKSGTMLFMKDQVVVFMWSVKDAWAFAGVNFAGQPQAVDFAAQVQKANLVGAKDMRDIARFLETLGFTRVTPDKLPPVLTAAAAQGAGWLAEMAQRMVTVLIIPAGLFIMPEEYQQYEG